MRLCWRWAFSMNFVRKNEINFVIELPELIFSTLNRNLANYELCAQKKWRILDLISNRLALSVIWCVMFGLENDSWRVHNASRKQFQNHNTTLIMCSCMQQTLWNSFFLLFKFLSNNERWKNSNGKFLLAMYQIPSICRTLLCSCSPLFWLISICWICSSSLLGSSAINQNFKYFQSINCKYSSNSLHGIRWEWNKSRNTERAEHIHHSDKLDLCAKKFVLLS